MDMNEGEAKNGRWLSVCHSDSWLRHVWQYVDSFLCKISPFLEVGYKLVLGDGYETCVKAASC